MTIRLATAQMSVLPHLDTNLPRILGHIERAAAEGAQFVLFPEGALTGYHGDTDPLLTESGLVRIGAACADSGICALVGTTYRDGQTVHNQVRIYDETGLLVGAHSKTIPTRSDLKWHRPGGGPQVFEHRGLRFGALICNDLWCTPPAPLPDTHLVQQLAEGGARIVFHAINSGFDLRYLKWHTAHLETLAWSHRIHILTANASGDLALNAPSGLVGPNGEWLAQADPVGEHLLVVDADLPDEAVEPGPTGL